MPHRRPDVVGARRPERTDRATLRGEAQEQLADVARGLGSFRRADFEEAGVLKVAEQSVEAGLRRVPVARRVLAIGGVEHVEVVLCGAVARVDNLADQRERGGHERATRSRHLEKFLLGEFPGLRRVRDEHDLEVVVLAAQALHGPEEE